MATSSPTPTLNPLLLPTDQQERLHHLAPLLHLFHHRNHNQHHHSIWYRPFSLFRRELSHLTSDISLFTDTTTTTTHLARARKKVLDATLLARTERRIHFWRDVMVSKWYRAFGQLVADGRFAVLGVVLMAVLGEVCGVVGITGQLEEMGQREVERVLEEFGREEWGLGRGGGGLLGGRAEEEEEDRGEVIVRAVREADDEEEGGTRVKIERFKWKLDGGLDEEMPTPMIDELVSKHVKERSPKASTSNPKRPRESTTAPSNAPSKPSKKKKKCKKGDAIDDLFAF